MGPLGKLQVAANFANDNKFILLANIFLITLVVECLSCCQSSSLIYILCEKAFVISINPFQVWWQQLNLISPSLSHSPAGHHLPLKEREAWAADSSRKNS